MHGVFSYGWQRDWLFYHVAPAARVRPGVKIFPMASGDLHPTWICLSIFFAAITKVFMGDQGGLCLTGSI
jgi:hypothetical protein